MRKCVFREWIASDRQKEGVWFILIEEPGSKDFLLRFSWPNEILNALCNFVNTEGFVENRIDMRSDSFFQFPATRPIDVEHHDRKVPIDAPERNKTFNHLSRGLVIDDDKRRRPGRQQDRKKVRVRRCDHIIAVLKEGGETKAEIHVGTVNDNGFLSLLDTQLARTPFRHGRSGYDTHLSAPFMSLSLLMRQLLRSAHVEFTLYIFC